MLEHGQVREPYWAWCEDCVTDESLARVELDWSLLGSKEGATPILCGKDQQHLWYYAIPLPRKSCDDHDVNTTAGGTSAPDLGVRL